MRVGKPFKQITRAANKVDYRNLGEIASTFRHVSSVNGEIAYGQYNYFREDVNNIWVDNGGDDRLNGSFRQPKRSIEEAVDLAQSGDIVNVLPGDYYPNRHIELKDGVILNFYPASKVHFDYEVNPFSGYLFEFSDSINPNGGVSRVIGDGAFYISQSGSYNKGLKASCEEPFTIEFECRTMEIYSTDSSYQGDIEDTRTIDISYGFIKFNLKSLFYFGENNNRQPIYVDGFELSLNIEDVTYFSNVAGTEFLYVLNSIVEIKSDKWRSITSSDLARGMYLSGDSAYIDIKEIHASNSSTSSSFLYSLSDKINLTCDYANVGYGKVLAFIASGTNSVSNIFIKELIGRFSLATGNESEANIEILSLKYTGAYGLEIENVSETKVSNSKIKNMSTALANNSGISVNGANIITIINCFVTSVDIGTSQTSSYFSPLAHVYTNKVFVTGSVMRGSINGYFTGDYIDLDTDSINYGGGITLQ